MNGLGALEKLYSFVRFDPVIAPGIGKRRGEVFSLLKTSPHGNAKNPPSVPPTGGIGLGRIEIELPPPEVVDSFYPTPKAFFRTTLPHEAEWIVWVIRA